MKTERLDVEPAHIRLRLLSGRRVDDETERAQQRAAQPLDRQQHGVRKDERVAHEH